MSPGPAVQADPVVSLLAQGLGEPRSLYYLWERQQWSAGKIDLATDASQWNELDPGTRRPVADSVAWRRLRAEVATTALVPFVDLAPSEEQQVFLTTQLVDEARHLVFFDRVLTEVVGVDGATPEERGGVVDGAAAMSLLTEVLPALAAALKVPGAGERELVAAVTGYHLLILGALGLTEQHAVMGHLSERDALPGLRRGLAFEARDAHRHVAFGLGFLVEALRRDPALSVVAQRTLERTLPLVRSALIAGAQAAPVPYSGEELERSANGALRRWLEQAGLELVVRS